MVLSPDGTQVLVKGEDGLLTLFPVDGGTPRIFPELDGTWRQARWMGDSKSFFVFRTGRIPAPVFRVDVATGAKEPWTEIEPLERSGISGVNSLLMARDGERYVCSYSKLASSLFHARGLR